MKGYWNKPEQTAEAFDSDGFFHTGDIAEIDEDGFVLIVDRKKDLIVTAGGKNIAPQPVESHLSESRFVDTAVLVGDGRPYLVALISPDFDELERWAAEQGLDRGNRDELVLHHKTRQLFDELVAAENASLARFEQIKKFRLLPVTLSIEGGHLTPTLKVKRRVIEQQFCRALESMYSEAPPL
jgi:long-chain acyl-CoA synthetase